MERAMRLFFVALAMNLTMISPTSSEQVSIKNLCDSLRPVTSFLGYRLRQPEARCEGLYESAVRAFNLELVGVLAVPSFDYSGKSTVEVIGPSRTDIPPELSGPIRVRAVALPLKAYYRMDGVLDEASRLIWPLEEVVAPAGLDSGQVGLFGWIGSEIDKVFVPLRLTQNAQEDKHDTQAIQLTIRVSRDAEKMFWRTIEGGEEAEWREAQEGPIRAGQVVAVNMPAGPAGIVRVDFTAKPENSDRWTSLRFDVLRTVP